MGKSRRALRSSLCSHDRWEAVWYRQGDRQVSTSATVTARSQYGCISRFGQPGPTLRPSLKLQLSPCLRVAGNTVRHVGQAPSREKTLDAAVQFRSQGDAAGRERGHLDS